VPSFKITIAYDGSRFVGWQRQINGPSVQGLIEEALRELDEDEVSLAGAGRTDAGVHALGQVASFTLRRVITADVLRRALNSRLPDEVRIVSAEEVPASFHARFVVSRKAYRYRIWNADVLNPFEREYAWHVRAALDLDAMQSAARLLEGRHDFAAFQAADGTQLTTAREIFSSRLVARDSEPGAALSPSGRLITYEISGSGFLRHMVRAIAGSLVEIGCGRHRVEWLSEVLAGRDRTRAGPTAPAHGLFLVRVDYMDGQTAGGSLQPTD
jgi:tRNA pseudouridine38-40 synthase